MTDAAKRKGDTAERCPGSGQLVKVMGGIGRNTRWATCPVCGEPVTPIISSPYGPGDVQATFLLTPEHVTKEHTR